MKHTNELTPSSSHNHHDMHGDMSGHESHEMMMNHGGHMMHMGNLKQKFWVSLILTIPVIIMSPMMGIHLPFQVSFHPWTDLIVAVLGTIIFIYGGYPFFSGARGELASHRPAMMTLIAMGITVAFVYSIYAVIANQVLHLPGHVMDFFWELVTLIDIMLLGHWIEMRTLMNAGSALDQLAALLPSTAHRINGHQLSDVPIQQLAIDDTVEVRAGEKFPADGQVVSGTSSVNEAMLTGEARPITKHPGDLVIGGALNGEGTLRIEVTGTGKSGYLSQVMSLVQTAQNSKSAKENMADHVAGLLFYAALTIAVVAFIAWLTFGNLAIALSIAVTVLIIACPHALGLAIPLVVARSTAIAASHGLLIQNRNAIETVNQLKFVLLDKTGTLTEGHFTVHDVQSTHDSISNDHLLQMMASLESGASHPLAASIVAQAHQQHIPLLSVTDMTQQTGVGIIGIIDGQSYQIVSPAYLVREHLDRQVALDQLLTSGDTISFLVSENQVLGYITQGDMIKSGAFELIHQLQQQHLTPVMLTGDHSQSAQRVAHQLGITDVHASLMPEDKERLVRQYQSTGQVMMVGDGVNDAPSLARADIGVAIGSGTQVAISAADVILVRSDPNSIIEFIELAKKTNRKMVQNLWWGAGYNIITIPLAAGILAPIGFTLNPMVGAVIMSLSTVVVAINALTLRQQPTATLQANH